MASARSNSPTAQKKGVVIVSPFALLFVVDRLGFTVADAFQWLT